MQRTNRSEQTGKSLAEYGHVVFVSQANRARVHGNDVVLPEEANLPKFECQDLLDPTPVTFPLN